MKLRALVAATTLSAIPCLAAPAAAQEYLDTGTFLLHRAGAEAGRVEFAIRPSPARGVLLVATAILRGREIQHALELTPEHVPVSFQQTERVGGRVVRRFTAQLAGTRFSLRFTSNEGETAREFPVRPPVVVLGEEDYAGFYFVPRSGDVTVVRATDGRATRGTVRHEGPDTVTVGSRTLAADRYALSLADGEERRFWFTSSGDLLQVAVPATGLIATRTEPAGR